MRHLFSAENEHVAIVARRDGLKAGMKRGGACGRSGLYAERGYARKPQGFYGCGGDVA